MQLPKKHNNLPFILLAFLIAACGNDNKTAPPVVATDGPAVVVEIPKVMSFDIVNTYPHDPAAFTEGLEFKDGFLYESVGNYGHSDIRKVDLKTGKVLASTPLDAKYFGEGMSILNNKIYQLTYREGKGFIYDLKSLKRTGTFTFDAAEGWGMTNDGHALIYDDGTNVLRFLDPTTFRELKRLAVTDEHGPVNELNELELINGFIYANQWRTENLLKIDTTTGKVVARADLSSLRQRLGIAPVSGTGRGPDVLNGIAWDAASNKIYVTGKNWPKLAEIKLDN